MYRLRFLNDSEQLRLEDIVSTTFNAWMSAWVLYRNCSVTIKAIKCSELVDSNVVQFIGEDDKVPLFFSEEHFNWGRFIFNNIQHDCHSHPKYLTLIDRIKSDLLNNIFNQKNSLSKKNISLPRSVDAYLMVLIGSSEIGFMKFIAPHAYFMSLIEKSISKRTPKLTGDRFSLISNLKVPIRLKMQLNDMSFPDLINMKSGAILKSTVDFENSFLLNVGDNQIANVSIGKRKDHKAYLVKGKVNG